MHGFAEQQLPTAYIDAGPAFTNAVNLTVKILFEAACADEGFRCWSRSTCDVSYLLTLEGLEHRMISLVFVASLLYH